MYKDTQMKKALKLGLKALVPKAGIEPARCCHHWILNPARLPIPPLRLIEVQK